ncbi:hypothetical protein BKG82_13090 [Mycobacteroides chelonae]|uniref:Uncharacterized protein n=1 Tax=Mycobacteroides chelonae TaxID=1774 RepID=A0A1S1LTW5_MYCCH|nr:hypothetical protein [Mycobacteroides chelonae]OHU57118.1 hypothetical protein BKG82_13090 [Mycobacteroides chelonae]
MKKPIIELQPGDVIVALAHPDGRTYAMRGGPLEVAGIEHTGGQCDGAPQIKICAANRNRAARFANGATHAVLQE